MRVVDVVGVWVPRARRWQVAARSTCRRCGSHRAVFLRLGEVRRDRHHGLCPRCYRSEYDRSAARLLLLAS